MSHNHINWFLFSEEMRARFLFVKCKQPEIELQDLNLSSVLMKLKRSILTLSLKCSFKWGYFTLFSSFFSFFSSSLFLFFPSPIKKSSPKTFFFFSRKSWPLPELSNLASLLSFFVDVFLSTSTYVEAILFKWKMGTQKSEVLSTDTVCSVTLLVYDFTEYMGFQSQRCRFCSYAIGICKLDELLAIDAFNMKQVLFMTILSF